MRRSYILVLIVQVLMGLFLVANNFFFRFLKGYSLVLFLFLSLLLLFFLVGCERITNKYTKKVCFLAFVYSLSFLVIYYFIGFFVGFAKSINCYSIDGFFLSFLPMLLLVVFEELMRFILVRKVEYNRLLSLVNIALFVLLDLAIYFNSEWADYSFFVFLSFVLLPIIAENVSLNYVSKKSGFYPTIIYKILVRMYFYFLVIIPDPNIYLYSFIFFVTPIAFAKIISVMINNTETHHIERNYKKIGLVGFIFPVLFSCFMIYFTSGYFGYRSYTIASGSMSPYLNKGDMVIIKETPRVSCEQAYKIGDVVAYQGNSVIVHRIVNMNKYNNVCYFYVKGDKNEQEDDVILTINDIIGVVKYKIPYIGIPAVWFLE